MRSFFSTAIEDGHGSSIQEFHSRACARQPVQTVGQLGGQKSAFAKSWTKKRLQATGSVPQILPARHGNAKDTPATSL